MGRYIRGDIDDEMLLGTLNSKVVVSAALDQTVNERTLATSMVAIHAMINFTAGAADGPILVGIAHSDYSSAEIEAWIENQGSWDEGNLIGQEVGNRKIRKIGIFEVVDLAITGATVLNDGKPIKTKLNWILNQGTTLRQWAYNLGTSALDTTDPTYHLQGHVNLFPK